MPTPQEHLDAFVESFVLRDKKERWQTLFRRRGAKGVRESHKLREALDARFCSRVSDVSSLASERVGVFFDFSDDPAPSTVEAAIARGTDTDAVFSLESGHLAVYFFHEGEVWLCRR